MNTSVQNILKKINYIEAEVEIQKQILFSLASDQKSEIEEVVKKISSAKEQVGRLRKQIQAISPEEYQKIIDIENGLTNFKQIATKKQFKVIEHMSVESSCLLKCRDGRTIACLVKACDDNGDWTILTSDGKVLNISEAEAVSEGQE